MRYNPFRPNSVVGPGIFSGRHEEISSIAQCLFQTKNGNPQHFLIEGERGIGKSSLLFLSQALATTNYDGQDFSFIVLSVEMSASTSFRDMVAKISSMLRYELLQKGDLKTLAKTAWDFAARWSLGGVEYKQQDTDYSDMSITADLAVAIRDFVSHADKTDGILITIDEADKPDPSSCNLGEFCWPPTYLATTESRARVVTPPIRDVQIRAVDK